MSDILDPPVIEPQNRREGGIFLGTNRSAREQQWRENRGQRTVKALRLLDGQLEAGETRPVIVTFNERFRTEKIINYFTQHFGINPIDEGLYVCSSKITVVDPEKSVIEIQHPKTHDDLYLPGAEGVVDLVTLHDQVAVTCLKAEPDQFSVGVLPKPF
ncbi:TPA: hypothetical protein EYO12_03335 [Candidatus Saccharibacteria bacterium]|nr:hypothetical protein [Candidatus Saccharibacteria bacterium]HIO87933.1 hypothetical protein [Candidatus Saccharibacteria bacterium]